MKFKSFLTILLFLVATVFTAHAQNTTVSGKVSDGVENLNGVNVVIQGTSAGVVSDNNGFFSISSDKELPWTLEFSSLGYSSQSLIVSSNSQVISVTLVSGEPLEEVVVSGSRKPEKVSESVASITTINLKEIERRPTFNAANLLDNVVGVQVDKQGANRTNVTLRDQVDIFSTSTLVMLDYRDLSQVGLNIFDSGNSNLSMIDLERVEVVRGPQAALYGAGVGAGVVHYQSKDPFKYPGSTLQLQAGAIGNGGTLFKGGFVNLKGNLNMKSVYFRHAVSNEDKTFGYKFNFRYSENGEFNLSDQQKQGVFGATGSRNIIDPLSNQQVGVSNVFRDNEHKGVDASLYYRPNNNFSFTAVAGMGSTIGNAWTTGTGEVFADQNSHFLQFRLKSNDLFAQYNYTVNKPGRFDDEIGFNYRTGLVSYMESTQSQLQVQQEIGLDMINTDLSLGFEHKLAQFDTFGRTFGRNENNDDYRVYGAYLSSKTDLTDDLILALSGRFDRFVMLDESAFSPRVGLVWKASPRHSLRLTYNKSHTPPSALNMFLDIAVANLTGGDIWVLGNSQAQTFNNVRTSWLFGGGLVPSNPGIGMSHATLFGVLAPGISALVSADPTYAALKGFLPMLADQNTLAAVAGQAGFTTGRMVDLDGKEVNLQNGDKGTLQIDNTYELGFKGMLSDNLSLSFDVYNAQKENFVAQRILSPLVSLPTLGADFIGTVKPLLYSYALNTIFPTLGLPAAFGPATADQLATNMANLMAGAAIQNGIAGNTPVGVIQSDQAPEDGGPHLMMGYKNFGKISYWGFDTALNWRPTDDLTMYANYSVVSETEFEKDEIGALDDPNSYFMNHSKHRVKTGFNYSTGKYNFGLSHKYDSGFNADMGTFYSGAVKQRNIYDFNVGMNINSKTYFDLALYNVAGKRYSVFPGMPLMGMSGIATLRLEL